ncbi:MAG: type II toxin-antitoxin system RelE family toxin [Actinomycetota bacterium]
MSRYEVIVTGRARKFIERLEQRDRARIITALRLLELEPRPRQVARLSDTGEYRVRVGDYRIIYEINDRVLVVKVVRVGHRREVYRP